MCKGRGSHLPTVLGMAGVLGLLTYPLPTAWLGLAALLGLALARWRRTGRPLPRTPFAIPFALYLAGGLVGLLVSFRPSMAEIRFFGLLAAGAVLVLLVDLARSERAARRAVLGGLLLAAAAAPLLAIVVGPYLRPDRLPGLSAELILGPLAAFDPIRAPILDADAVMQRYRLRSSGLGLLALFGIGLALGPTLAGPTRGVRLLGGVAVGYFGLFALLSGHRLSIILAGLLLVAAVALRYRRAAVLLVGSSAMIAVTACTTARSPDAAVDSLVRLLPEAATDLGPLAVRRELWRNAFFMLGDFPLTGVGMGIRSSRTVFGDYFAMIDTGLRHGHDVYVQTYLEQGLVGLVGLVAVSLVAALVGWRTLRRAHPPWIRAMAISGSAACAGLVLSGLTEIGLTTTIGGVLLFGALGLMAAAERATVRSVAPPAGSIASGSGRPAPAAIMRPAARRPRATPAILPGVVAATLLLAATSGPPLRHATGSLYLNLGNLALHRAALGAEDGGPGGAHLPAAEQLLHRAMAFRPDDPRVYRALAAVELARERPRRAEAWLERAETHTGHDDQLGWFQLARLYREADDVDEALDAWARVGRDHNAWSCSGKDMQLLRWSARLARAGRWSAAEKTARASIEAMPIYPPGYRLLSTAVSRRDGRQPAATAMIGLVDAWPNVPWPYLELADLHAGLGRPAEARAWAERAAAVKSSDRWSAEQRRHEIRDCRQHLEDVTYAYGAAPGAAASAAR